MCLLPALDREICSFELLDKCSPLKIYLLVSRLVHLLEFTNLCSACLEDSETLMMQRTLLLPAHLPQYQSSSMWTNYVGGLIFTFSFVGLLTAWRIWWTTRLSLRKSHILRFSWCVWSDLWCGTSILPTISWLEMSSLTFLTELLTQSWMKDVWWDVYIKDHCGLPLLSSNNYV